MRTRRTKTEQVERRGFILDTARSLFARRGVENVSMDEIARAAHYTRRTLYAYFKSADEIRLLILTEDLRRRWEVQKPRVAAADAGLAKLIAWAEALYDFTKENLHATRLQAYWDYRGINRKHVSRESFNSFVTINDELAEGLRAIFRLGIKDHSLRPDLDVDMCISQLLHSLRSVLYRALSPNYSFAVFEPDDYVQHFLELFTRAVRNTKGQLV